MKIKITIKHKTIVKEVEDTESSVWKAVGEELLNVEDKDIPSFMFIQYQDYHAVLSLTERGEVYRSFSHASPSLYVVLEEDSITPHLKPSCYEQKYLTCINPYGNNYKFYWIKPINHHGITKNVSATYGRIGTVNYPAINDRASGNATLG